MYSFGRGKLRFRPICEAHRVGLKIRQGQIPTLPPPPQMTPLQ